MRKYLGMRNQYLLGGIIGSAFIISSILLHHEFYKKDISIIPRVKWDPSTIRRGSLFEYRENLTKCLTNIVIHHSGFKFKPGPNYLLAYQLSMGYDDIAYHFIIDKDGDIYEGLPINFMGAHAGQTKEANELADKIRTGIISDTPIISAYKLDPDYGAIGICLDGNYELEKVLEVQLTALRYLLKSLCFQYKIGKANIFLHNEVKEKIVRKRGLTFVGNETVCPGKYARNKIKHLISIL